MKKVFYINDKLKSLLSNIIYEIQNYNSTIMKYTENIQNNIDNSNIIQLIDDFKIEDANWVESFINDYGRKHNKYSDYCIKTGGKLSKIIKKHQS